MVATIRHVCGTFLARKSSVLMLSIRVQMLAMTYHDICKKKGQWLGLLLLGISWYRSALLLMLRHKIALRQVRPNSMRHDLCSMRFIRFYSALGRTLGGHCVVGCFFYKRAAEALEFLKNSIILTPLTTTN